MRACWMVTILMCCRLSHATKHTFALIDNVNVDCTPPGQPVLIPCPSISQNSDAKFTLFRGPDAIHNITCKNKNNRRSCQPADPRNGVEFQANYESPNFTVSEAKAPSVYGCEVLIMYPPPVLSRIGTGILVLEDGYKYCNITVEKPRAANNTCSWFWILAVVLLILYGVTVTIVATVTGMKLRNTDSHSDYINTKPKAPRDRKKKKGVQNPIPYF